MCRYLNRIYKWSPYSLILVLITTACSTTPTDSEVTESSSAAEQSTMVSEVEPETETKVYEVDSADEVEIDNLPTTPEKNQVTLKQSAPEQYVVQKGDTLWDLSNKFLNQPWYWPEIWYMNPQVNNPHLIYPGDVINVFYVGGRPYLTVNSDTRISGIERLSPTMRGEPIEVTQKIIPIQAIEQFLIRPQIVDLDQLEASPYIVGSRDNRLVYGANDQVYVHNSDNLTEGGRFNVYRPGAEFKDPKTNEVLGYEAIHVGDGELTREGDPATLHLTTSKREVLRGDRIIEVEGIDADTAFYPHPPETEIDGEVIYLFDAISQVGAYQIVATNVGKQQGLEKGHVVAINKAGSIVSDPLEVERRKDREIQLPSEKTADAIVFRVFDRISYLFILDADRPVRNGDLVKTP